MIIVAGLDLAGSERRASGICFMDEKLRADFFIIYSNNQIIEEILKRKPKVVAIDAPLSIPKGRKSLEERSKVHLRECDRELLRLKIKFFPITLGPMRMLTSRGIMIKKELEKYGFHVIEVFPGATQDILNIPRKHQDIKGLLEGLKRIGIKNLRENMNGDELDAVTCAYTALLYLKGNYIALGNEEEGQIIIPKIYQ